MMVICDIGRKPCNKTFQSLADMLNHAAEVHTPRQGIYYEYYLALAAKAEREGQ